MNVNPHRKDLADLAAELEGISSLLCIISSEFLEDQVIHPPHIIGSALFALEQYANTLADELDEIDCSTKQLENHAPRHSRIP